MRLRRYFHDYRTSGLRKCASAVKQKRNNHDDGHDIAIVAPPHPPLTPTTGRKPSDTSTSLYAAIYLPSEWPPPSLSFVPSLCRPRAFAIIELPYHRRKIVIGPNEAKNQRIPPNTPTRHRRCVYSAIPRLHHPRIASRAITNHRANLSPVPDSQIIPGKLIIVPNEAKSHRIPPHHRPIIAVVFILAFYRPISTRGVDGANSSTRPHHRR